MTSEETLINWEEPAAVTAVNIMVISSIAPRSPIRFDAAVGATSPNPISFSVNVTPVAMAANPSVVASVNGIANHASPPMMNPPVAAFGLDAMALCQYD